MSRLPALDRGGHHGAVRAPNRLVRIAEQLGAGREQWAVPALLVRATPEESHLHVGHGRVRLRRSVGQVDSSRGHLIRTIGVTVTGDRKREPDEVFYINLVNPSGATIVDGQGVGTLRNDDR